MSKILLATYSAETHSSYGIVTRELWKRLKRMHPEWKIVQHGWLHTSTEKVPWEIIPTRRNQTPDGPRWDPNDKFGKTTFPDVVDKFRPDLVWTLGDVYMCDYMGQYRSRFGFKLVKHIAIDGAPVPESYKDSLVDSDEVIPVSNFGRRILKNVMGMEPGPFIYHGVDLDRFQPKPEHYALRPEVGNVTKNTFLIGFVGHSQWRKQNWNMFKMIRHMRDGAFVECTACNRVTLSRWDDVDSKMDPLPEFCGHCGCRATSPGPQDVGIWYHTFDRTMLDINPERMKAIWGVEGSIIFTKGQQSNEGRPDELMPQLYQIIDAYISLSGGEGFCIPLVEAMASGVPVIYTDYSGQAEVGAYAGLPVRYHDLQPNPQIPVNRAIADVAHAIQQTLRLMRDKKLRQSLSMKALNAARDVFSWDLIAQQWSDVLMRHLDSPSVPTLGVSL